MGTLQILLAATTLADQVTIMLDRYGNGDMTDDELAAEWVSVTSRVARAEAIMAKAKQMRASRRS